MRIALLGYGKEGQAAEKYFSKFGAEFEILTDFDPKEIAKRDFSGFDLVLRSPSVHPFPGATSLTRYFFEKCPCPIIGVTATKGKGTTCSFIKSLLDALGEKAFLVGNIGEPAINALDDLTPDSVVVYEMSSFQLWDLERSPVVAVVGTIEPDHLNVHDGFDDYISAKANIGRHQSSSDTLVYFANNPDTKRIADQSPARKLTYPTADIPIDMPIIINALIIASFESALPNLMVTNSTAADTIRTPPIAMTLNWDPTLLIIGRNAANSTARNNSPAVSGSP